MTSATGNSAPFPPPPWRLRGHGQLHVQGIALDRARALIPSCLNIVPAMPGRTLGGIYCATYEAGSTLEYSELIVIPGLVRHRHRVGAWISHIYVDEPLSIAGGRHIWSLPKEEASFRQHPDGGKTISQGGAVLCTLGNAGRRRTPGLLLPLMAPVISKGPGGRVRGTEEDSIHWFRGTGSAFFRTGGSFLYVPPDSPFASLGLGNGQRIHLDRMDLLMHAPG